MSEIRIPDTVRVINAPSDYPLELRDAAKAVTNTVADAASFRVQGVVNTLTRLADIKNLRIKRGLAAQSAQYIVTAATAAQITVTGTIPANTKAFFKFHVEGLDRIARFRRGTGYEYGIRPIVVDVTLQPGDGAADVLTKLNAGINAFTQNHMRDLVFKSSYTGGVLTIDFEEKGAFLKKVEVEGADDLASAFVTVFAPVTTRAAIKGIGTGERLEFYEKIKEGNALDVRNFDFDEIPLKKHLYTEIAWTTEYDRKDPKSSELSNRKSFVLYVNEAVGEAYIDSFADLFLTGANIAKMAKLEAENGIQVGFNDAEAIVLAADAAAGQLDSSDYGTPGYVVGVAPGTGDKYVQLASVGTPADAEGNATVLAKVKANA